MLTLVEAPAELPLSLAEARAGARLDGMDDDALIAGYLRSAVAQIDGRDGWLGRCLITQTWHFDIPRFPPCVIALPLPPLQSVTSITYVDPADVEQILDPAAYDVVGADPGRIVKALGQSWPATRDQLDAVRITFVAGYGDHNAVPEPIRQALQLMVANAYDGCHGGEAKALLLQFRSWGF